MTEDEKTADSQAASQTTKAPSVISRFVEYLAGHKLASGIKITCYGLFVSQSLYPQIISEFQSWLKADSGAAGLLEEGRCAEILFQDSKPLSYYILDGRNCQIGFIIVLDRPAPTKSHFMHYAGTPLDGRKTIHPKDPVLNNLPSGIKLSSGLSGFDLYFEKDNLKMLFPLARVSEILELFYNSPRLRKYKRDLSGALRDILPVFSKLMNSGRSVERSRITLIPALIRKQRSAKFFRVADIILVINEQGGLEFGYGLKGKNLFDFVVAELRGLTRNVRSRRIGVFELGHRDRHIAGSLHNQKEKFQVELKALLDWIQIHKLKADSSRTLFDYISAFANEFTGSGWTIERDIPPRYRGRPASPGRDNRHGNKAQINYRSTKRFLFWIGRTSNLIAVRRWIRLKPRSVEIVAPLGQLSVQQKAAPGATKT